MIFGWMTLFSIFALAIGLAMDSAAASASRGLAAKRITWWNVALVAGLFGGAQAIMPLLGSLLGHAFGPFVEDWDHWIAFVLLAGIGGKMLYEAFQDRPGKGEEPHPFRLRILLLLAVATSIDSFAAGIALPLIDAPLLLSVAVIGGVTAALSAVGVVAGRRFGALLGRRMDVFGGLVLIFLGTKILIEHLRDVA